MIFLEEGHFFLNVKNYKEPFAFFKPSAQKEGGGRLPLPPFPWLRYCFINSVQKTVQKYKKKAFQLPPLVQTRPKISTQSFSTSPSASSALFRPNPEPLRYIAKQKYYYCYSRNRSLCGKVHPVSTIFGIASKQIHPPSTTIVVGPIRSFLLLSFNSLYIIIFGAIFPPHASKLLLNRKRKRESKSGAREESQEMGIFTTNTTTHIKHRKIVNAVTGRVRGDSSWTKRRKGDAI